MFLLAESILIAAYVYIYRTNVCLGTAIAVFGALTCILSWLHFRKLPQRLDRFEKQLDSSIKVKLELPRKWGGRKILAKVAPWLFAAIWLFFLYNSASALVSP